MQITVPPGCKAKQKLVMAYDPLVEGSEDTKSPSKKSEKKKGSASERRNEEFLEEQRRAYEALQLQFMKKTTKEIVVQVPEEALGSLVQIRTDEGQLLQFDVPEGLDPTQPFVNVTYESFVKSS